jgi:large subunit ribosomal protein L21
MAPVASGSIDGLRMLATSTASTSTSTTTLPSLLPPASAAERLSSLPQDTPTAVSFITSSSTPSHGRYVLARLHSRTFLLHPKDILTVPHLKGSPPPGTLLGLNRIMEVGSREYILRAPKAVKDKTHAGAGGEALEGERPVLPSNLVKCNLTVLEHTKSPLERKLLKKRRKGYKKTIQHKQGWTRLRVGDILLDKEVVSA